MPAIALGRPARWLAPGLIFIALVVAVIGSLGAPLITSVATGYRVSLASAQWTLTLPLLTGAIAAPVLGRLGAGAHRRAAVLATLIVVVAGSLLTVLASTAGPAGPAGFGLLLLGRGGQGIGLGLTPLVIGIARDHLTNDRIAHDRPGLGSATSAIAQISVASTVGIGVGYPVAGWLTDLAGVRAAYLLGLALTVAALLVGWLLVPASPSGRAARLDLTGASWLAAGLLLLLLMISQNQWWRDRPVVATGGLIVALLLLAGWAARQWRQPEPLLDLRLLRQPTMLGANASMLLGGVGMYLLVTLITRFVQSPDQAGYGFGFSTFQAGLVLVPFSALGFLGGRLTPRLNQRVNPIASLAVSSIVVLLAFVLFATARSSWYLPVLAMAVLGYGVGSFSAAMPAVILPVTAAAETSAAMAANQVVRSVGFSIGSAVGGLILAANTGAGRRFPAEHGYVVAAWLGAVIMLATAALVAVTGRGGAARTDGQCLAPATNRGQH